MDNMKHRRLQELDRSDFEVIKDEPDIRGWDVKLAGGQTVGEVEELILDAQEKKVRYMVVDLHEVKDIDLVERKVLIPIGLAELDKDEDEVLIPRVAPLQLMNLPEYDADQLTPEMERQVCLSLGRDFDKLAEAERRRMDKESLNENVKEMHLDETEQPKSRESKKESGDETDPEFYRHEYYNLDTIYKNRLHEAQPVNLNEYDEGLRLWEKRSEGGIIEEGQRRERREMDEKHHAEIVKNRRSAYEERRRCGDRQRYQHPPRKDNSIIDRIKNEGLRDA
ncbi:MAG: PRC-barrel domain-containing protein [Flavisolibacter sp.]